MTKSDKLMGSYLDAGAPALAHGVWDSGPRGVDHGHDAHKAEVVRGEVHLLSVEGEVLWKLLVWEVVVAEAWRYEEEEGVERSRVRLKAHLWFQ